MQVLVALERINKAPTINEKYPLIFTVQVDTIGLQKHLLVGQTKIWFDFLFPGSFKSMFNSLFRLAFWNEVYSVEGGVLIAVLWVWFFFSLFWLFFPQLGLKPLLQSLCCTLTKTKWLPVQFDSLAESKFTHKLHISDSYCRRQRHLDSK